jgi:hypothetical protein
MHSHAARILRCLATVLALATVAAPAATAGRYGPGTPSRASEQPTVHMPRATCHQYCASVDQHESQPLTGRPITTSVRPRIVTVDDGFDWSDAGIGFGAACGLALLTLGTLLLRRQSRIRQAREPEPA